MADVSGNMSEKLKALEAARLQIDKQYGQNSLMRLGLQGSVAGVDVVPSVIVHVFSIKIELVSLL